MPSDLHCHTYFSDGSDSPEEVVLLAKCRGLAAVSVTDHDTVAGSEAAVACGRKLGMGVIPGVEISAFDPQTGHKAHLLCYMWENPGPLLEICRTTCEARTRAGQRMLEKVLKLYPIPAAMAVGRSQRSASLFKQHIMRALMDAGYAKEMYGEEYKKLFDPVNGSVYESVRYPKVEDVLARIRRAGGLAVLAHPCEYDGFGLLQRLASAGLIDGVEVRNPSNRPGDEERFSAVADAFGLAKTGGTDFHGMNRKNPMPLGSVTTDDDQLGVLLGKKKSGSGGEIH